MTTPRPACAIVVALAIGLVPTAAFACSTAAGYEVAPNWDELGPANAELRFWHGYDAVVSFELTDEKGRRVPATVTVTPIPGLSARSFPFYDWMTFYTTLAPLRSLASGRYETRLARDKYPVRITSFVDRVSPGVVTRLRARIVTKSTAVGYQPNCEPIVEPRPFLELSFNGPTEEGLLYEMNWAAAKSPTRGLRAERLGDGSRAIRIPVGWFGDVSADSSPSAIELRAVDLAGNRSQPVRVRLPTLPPPPPRNRGPLPAGPTPVPRQVATDLRRFTRLAASDETRDAFAVLTELEPSPVGSRYDANFQESVLGSDQSVTLLATVRGGEGRVSLFLPVRIQAGRASPALAAAELRLLIAAFPLHRASVSSIRLDVWHDRTVEITITENGELRRLGWRPEDDHLGWAAEHGTLGIVRELIQAGATIEGRARSDSLELTPLMRAAQAGEAAVVRFLLDSGANPNAKTKEGATALSGAAKAGHAHVMRALLDAGADPTIPQFDWSPLRQAAFHGRTEAVLLLLARGVAPDSKVDAGENTALMTAAWAGHAETVRALLDRGADPNAINGLGRTALMYAASQPHREVVRMLLDRNADVSVRAKDGRTALSSAIALGIPETIELLIEAKADVNMPGEKGEVPLSQARRRPQSPVSQRIVDLLLSAGARERH